MMAVNPSSGPNAQVVVPDAVSAAAVPVSAAAPATPIAANGVDQHKHDQGSSVWSSFKRSCLSCWRRSFDPNSMPPLYAEDYRRSFSLFLYYKWVNPWIRFLLILPILYVYVLSSAILTWRVNDWEDELARDNTATVSFPNPDSPLVIQEGDPNKQYPFSPDTHPTKGGPFRPFILRDLGYDWIPGAAEYGNYNQWQGFVDATPIIFTVAMGLSFLLRRDIIRFAEYGAIQMIMFPMNALVHVVTTLPDPHNLNYDSCQNPKYHTWGNWVYFYVTTSYCGDLIWSNHTANTLIPLILMRRVLWDWLGWNFNTKYEKEQPIEPAEYYRYDPKIHKPTPHSSICSSDSAPFDVLDHDNDYDRQTQIYHQAHLRHLALKQQQSQSKLHANALPVCNAPPATVPTYQPQPAQTSDPSTIEQLNHQQEATQIGQTKSYQFRPDSRALDPHDRADIHIPISATDQEASDNNFDHDELLHPLHSPYTTPAYVIKHHRFFVCLSYFIRLLFVAWFTVLLFSLLVVRYHYSVDIVVAVIVTVFVTGHTRLLQWWVRMIYRPYYHNYVYQGKWWKPVYLSWPLNAEQINFEERVRRVSLGGYL